MLREQNSTLVDLLDRAMDKGLLIDVDIIISVAGIPLLGLKLSAALAGVDTMKKYGLWSEKEASRAQITPARQKA
jgi:hypothetical protein